MTLEIYLVRHGESEINELFRQRGPGSHLGGVK